MLTPRSPLFARTLIHSLTYLLRPFSVTTVVSSTHGTAVLTVLCCVTTTAHFGLCRPPHASARYLPVIKTAREGSKELSNVVPVHAKCSNRMIFVSRIYVTLDQCTYVRSLRLRAHSGSSRTLEHLPLILTRPDRP
jgi:hypothetical protein